MFDDFYKEMLLDRVKLMYPHEYEEGVDSEMVSQYELMIYCADGSRYRFDSRMDTIRYYKPGYDPKERSDEAILRSFGYRLQMEMYVRGMTQTELANATGLSQQTISNYLNRKQSPDILKLNKIAKALDCSVEELLKD